MFEDIYIPEIDGALLTMLFYLDFAYDFLFGDQRSTPLVEQRMNWLEHQETLERRGVFHRTYRMSPESFARLALLLSDNYCPSWASRRSLVLAPYQRPSTLH